MILARILLFSSLKEAVLLALWLAFFLLVGGLGRGVGSVVTSSGSLSGSRNSSSATASTFTTVQQEYLFWAFLLIWIILSIRRCVVCTFTSMVSPLRRRVFACPSVGILVTSSPVRGA